MAVTLVLYAVFSGLVQSKEFCSAFREKGNRISYMYRRPYHTIDLNIDHNIIIDGKYWSLQFNDSIDSLYFKDDKQSKDAPVFDAKYLGAACLKRDNMQFIGCDTRLFNINELKTYTFAENKVADSFSAKMELSDFIRSTINPIEGLQVLRDMKPNFVTNCADRDIPLDRDDHVDFIAIHTTSANFTTMLSRRMRIIKEADYFQASEVGFRELLIPTNGKQVIGMFAHISSRKGHIVLMKDKQSVFWCFLLVNQQTVGSFLISTENEINIIMFFQCQHQQLIDCTVVDSDKDGDNDDNIGLVVGIVVTSIVCIIILLLIILVLLYAKSSIEIKFLQTIFLINFVHSTEMGKKTASESTVQSNTTKTLPSRL